MTALLQPPVAGLDELTVESRVIATPWSRIVRGIGLGQHPTGFDATAAQHIRSSFARLLERVGGKHEYTVFSAALSELVLDAIQGDTGVATKPLAGRVDVVAAAAARVTDPYARATASTILLSSIATLGLTADPAVATRVRLLGHETLEMIDEIHPDSIEDDNRGRHGDYEKATAWTAAMFALARFERAELPSGLDGTRVTRALTSIQQIPSPFFRGRGGSMLLSAAAVLGEPAPIAYHIASTLKFMDRPQSPSLQPTFPRPMSPAFVQAYPLLTMLNAIAVSGHHELLTHGQDRLAQAAALMATMDPVERTHMGLYYVMALKNLGRLDDQLPNLDEFVEALVGEWHRIDPGRDYFLYGISYAYLIQLAFFTGRSDLVTDEMVERMVTPFPRLETTAENRANRPYPFSYVLNVLGEVGLAGLLYAPHAAYGGRSPFDWVVDHLSRGGRAESARLYMLDHALIGWSLRLRSPRAGAPGPFGRYEFG